MRWVKDKKMKQWLVIGGFLCSMQVTAADLIDVYGDESPLASQVVQKYSKDIQQVELYLHQAAKQGDEQVDSAKFLEMYAKKIILTDKIRRELAALYVNFQTIYYVNQKDIYTTVEIVTKAAPERLRFISPEASDHDTTHEKPKNSLDIFEQEMAYNQTGGQLFLNNQLTMSPDCPIYHCSWGFKDAALRPYLALFNEAAKKKRALIIKTLRQDPDPRRRASAAMLVGHFSDPKEIVALLVPQVTDPDEGVRNNVIRVIGATVQKSKVLPPSLMPFIELLDSPIETDRNKSLIVILSAATPFQDTIIQHAGGRLLQLLQLKQPNNHDIAYQILKKISGKDFGEHQVAAWRAWIDQKNSGRS